MSLADWTLLRPGWLFALLPLAGLAWRVWRSPPSGAADWRRAVDAHLLPHLLMNDGRAGRLSGLVAAISGGVLLVLALAGPVVTLDGGEGAPTYRREVARVVLFDLSGTAGEAALARWRLKLLDLLRAVPEGETALIAYAGEPWLIAPLTADVETLARFVPELTPDLLPTPGDRPEYAFSMAARMLARRPAVASEWLWITAARVPPPMPAGLAGARLTVWREGDGAAPAGGWGEVVPLRPDDGDVRRIVSAWSARDAGRLDARPGKPTRRVEIAPWLLLALLPITALAFRRGVLSILLAPLCLAAFLTSGPAEAEEMSWKMRLTTSWADARGWRLYRAGDLAGAALAFADPRWRAAVHYRRGEFAEVARLLEGAKDADALYNRGNALARLGRLPEALAAYEAALRQRPGDADIRHNRDLVKRLSSRSPGRPKNDLAPSVAVAASAALRIRPTPGGYSGGGSPLVGEPGARPIERPPGGKPPPPPGGGGKGAENRTDAGQGGEGGGAPPADAAEREARQVAAQWMRQAGDDPGGLLRARLRSEQRRRQSGELERPW